MWARTSANLIISYLLPTAECSSCVCERVRLRASYTAAHIHIYPQITKQIVAATRSPTLFDCLRACVCFWRCLRLHECVIVDLVVGLKHHCRRPRLFLSFSFNIWTHESQVIISIAVRSANSSVRSFLSNIWSFKNTSDPIILGYTFSVLPRICEKTLNW